MITKVFSARLKRQGVKIWQGLSCILRDQKVAVVGALSS